MKYIPPNARKLLEQKKKQEEEVEKAKQEQEKAKLESKKEEKEILNSEIYTEGDEFEIVLSSVVISQIAKNKDFRGELLGRFINMSEDSKKKKKKKKKGKATNETATHDNKEENEKNIKQHQNNSDDENEDEEDVDEEEEEEEGDEDGENNEKKKKKSSKDKKKNKKTDLKKSNIVEISQSFCVCNNEDIFIDKVLKLCNMYQLNKQRQSELLNNLTLYFNRNKHEEEGEKYINEVSTYYEDYINVMTDLNFETISFGFYINLADLKKKEVLSTLLLSSLINKNSFVLCYTEKYGNLLFSAYKIDIEVILEIKNQIRNSTFTQFTDILNVELKKKGLNSKNILQRIPLHIKNSVISSIFFRMLKNKNKNYLAPTSYLNTLENDSLENHIKDTCNTLEMLKTEQDKIIKYKKDVFKQIQTQKVYLEKKKLEKEKNKIDHDNEEIVEEDVNAQNIFKNIPQPSLLFPYVLTMSNNLLNDNINSLCSNAIAKSYLYYKNTKPCLRSHFA
ncbi:conserved protein, unknown function [Hepatocystis sp. ex Piliocolobus tephrosceles]|nr:conserved protein, unknown function [Hepatocystis sp. ex Piliocolobus tephrosceles]